MGKRRKAPLGERSLLCFVQGLQGCKVVVECRDDVAIRGTLNECDVGMK